MKTQGGVAVARSIVDSAVSQPEHVPRVVAVAGALVAMAAFLAGRPEWLEAMGRGFAKLFGVASDLSTPDTAAGRWMAEHLDLLRIAGVAVAIVVLLFVTGSLSAVVVVLIALAVYELALSAYAIGVPRARRAPTPTRRRRRPTPALDVRSASASDPRESREWPPWPRSWRSRWPSRCGSERCGLPPMRSHRRFLRRSHFWWKPSSRRRARSSLAGLSAYRRRAHGEPGFARRSAPTNATGGTKMPTVPTNSLPLR